MLDTLDPKLFGCVKDISGQSVQQPLTFLITIAWTIVSNRETAEWLEGGDTLIFPARLNQVIHDVIQMRTMSETIFIWS